MRRPGTPTPRGRRPRRPPRATPARARRREHVAAPAGFLRCSRPHTIVRATKKPRHVPGASGHGWRFDPLPGQAVPYCTASGRPQIISGLFALLQCSKGVNGAIALRLTRMASGRCCNAAWRCHGRSAVSQSIKINLPITVKAATQARLLDRKTAFPCGKEWPPARHSATGCERECRRARRGCCTR
jgi:hypothetical protein